MYQSYCSDFDNSPLKVRNTQSASNYYFKKAFYKMDSLRRRGLFCDVTLVTRNIEIPAHKIVLASCSDFFENSFVKMGEEKLLSLEYIDGKTLSALVNYVYTCSIDIEISVTSVQDFLAAANFLRIKKIRKDCCRYLENNLNINTSFNILSIARNQNYVYLLKKAEDFIDKNISEIMNTQQFLNLSIDHLSNLIIRHTLKVPSEEKIYEGVISWVKHDLTTRSKHLNILMRHIRLSLIPTDYIRKYIRNESLFKADNECKKLISDALLSKHSPEIIKSKAKKGSQQNQILLVMDGECGEAEKTYEMYDFKTNHWSKIYSMPGEKNAYNLAYVNRKLYCVDYDDITEYDLENNRWGNSIKMNSPRGWCGVGVLNDSIYAAGGYYNGKRLRSVEKFDITSKKWSIISPMSIGIRYVRIGVLQGLLYAVGGFKCCNTLFNSVELYDPAVNIWISCSTLKTARYDPAVGCLRDKLYVIGGWDGTKVTKSVECFSLATNRFTPSASLNIPRSRSAVVTFDDKLYVIGGWDGHRSLDSIEVYWPENYKWELLPTTMNVARYGHGAVIIDKIIDF